MDWTELHNLHNLVLSRDNLKLSYKDFKNTKWSVGVDPGSTIIERHAGQVCFLNGQHVFFIMTFEHEALRVACKELQIQKAILEDIPSHFGSVHGDCERHKERFEVYNVPYEAWRPQKWQKELGDYFKDSRRRDKPSVNFMCKEYPHFEKFIINKKRGYNTNKSDSLFLAILASK